MHVQHCDHSNKEEIIRKRSYFLEIPLFLDKFKFILYNILLKVVFGQNTIQIQTFTCFKLLCTKDLQNHSQSCESSCNHSQNHTKVLDTRTYVGLVCWTTFHQVIKDEKFSLSKPRLSTNHSLRHFSHNAGSTTKILQFPWRSHSEPLAYKAKRSSHWIN